MTTNDTSGTGCAPRPRRRLRAAIIGLGLDDRDGGPSRILTGRQCLVVGGSERAHAEMLETILRLESELERMGREDLGDVPPDELAEIAWRIDSPELHAIALRLQSGLRRRGRSFEETSPEELTELAIGPAPA